MKPILIGTALVLLMLAGCRQPEPTPNASVQIQLQVELEPARVGATALLVTVRDAAGAAISDAQVSARGDMAHAGMAPVNGRADGGTDGQYRIPFEWTMGGDWFVEVTVTLADGTTASQRFDLLVAAEAGAPETTPETSS